MKEINLTPKLSRMINKYMNEQYEVDRYHLSLLLKGFQGYLNWQI